MAKSLAILKNKPAIEVTGVSINQQERHRATCGKKIYLCRKELISALKADKALKKLCAFEEIGAAKNLRIFADFEVSAVRNEVMGIVECHALKTVETTIAGKYEFDELADGDYWLFSELTHNPMVRTDKTPFQWSLWILPVRLTGKSELINLLKPSVVLIPKASEP